MSAIESPHKWPACATCGKPATCLGAYEDAKDRSYGCDDCCAHGCEDGYCHQLDAAGVVDAVERADHLFARLAARDAQIAAAMVASAEESERIADAAETLPVIRNGHIDRARVIRELVAELFGGAT